jgi:hypothetical protein
MWRERLGARAPLGLILGPHRAASPPATGQWRISLHNGYMPESRLWRCSALATLRCCSVTPSPFVDPKCIPMLRSRSSALGCIHSCVSDMVIHHARSSVGLGSPIFLHLKCIRLHGHHHNGGVDVDGLTCHVHAVALLNLGVRNLLTLYSPFDSILDARPGPPYGPSHICIPTVVIPSCTPG